MVRFASAPEAFDLNSGGRALAAALAAPGGKPGGEDDGRLREALAARLLRGLTEAVR